MKVAIVAPSSVPFVLGGAERLWNGLTAAINDLTPHDAELIKLPSREHNLIDLVRTYQAFAALDLSHFDLVVSTKYPAWMISHPNHVVYLQHVLRGLYDQYHLTGLPERATFEDGDLSDFQRFLRARPGRSQLDEVFQRFDELLIRRGRHDPAFAFPGPFAREIVHHLDSVGLAQGSVRRHLAISRTVANRAGYFPPGAVVEAVPHPSDLQGRVGGRNDYLFTASRLDGAKRLDLLIDSMQVVPPGVRLKIAGTGPEEERLRTLARHDARIEFLGYVSSAKLVDLYADALAVPFVPLDEDLGLITLEAMSCGKPVVTCTDAGGPTELVIDGVNGFVTAPTPAALGRALARLGSDTTLARRLGEAARSRAASVTWRRTVNAILHEQRPLTASRRGGRPRIVVTSTFVVTPPTGGGQLRCFHLARGLTSKFNVDIVSLAAYGNRPRSGDIMPGMSETAIPKSPEHQAEEVALTDRAGVPLTDILATDLVNKTPDYLEALDRALMGANAVLLAHPFLFRAVQQLRPDLPVIYDAHNAEFRLKASVLPNSPLGRDLLSTVHQVEGDATRQARLISSCSTEDADALQAEFHSAARFLVIPNGIEIRRIPFTNRQRRSVLAERWRAAFQRMAPQANETRHTALFVASWHPPNNEAAEQIMKLAGDLPDVTFLLIGGHCDYFASAALPPNVVPLGIVSEAVKLRLLQSTDVALNPMLSGSGTNLKIVEYFAAGVPVVSTPLGARGLEVMGGEHLIIAPIDQFADAIRRTLVQGAEADRMATAARRLAEERYDWDLLGQRFLDGVLEALAA